VGVAWAAGVSMLVTAEPRSTVSKSYDLERPRLLIAHQIAAPRFSSERGTVVVCRAPPLLLLNAGVKTTRKYLHKSRCQPSSIAHSFSLPPVDRL